VTFCQPAQEDLVQFFGGSLRKPLAQSMLEQSLGEFRQLEGFEKTLFRGHFSQYFQV
jgi:hypothetical protein